MLAWRLRTSLFLLLGVIVVGTLGYSAIEGWSVLDSFYMTIITLSTVGFREQHPLSELGRVFTSGLILVGVATVAYTAAKTMEALLEERLFHWRRIQMEIKRLEGHVVVCGYGRMGETLVQALRARNVQVVAIERDRTICEAMDRKGVLHVAGDATDDEILGRAGAQRAKALATVLPNDADNLFITLSARSLTPELTIVARASQEKNESKMVAAGATRVLNPYRSGGQWMVRQLLHPTVTDFLNEISAEETDLHLEEVRLDPGSELAGVRLREAPIRKELDVMVVGVRRPDHGLLFNPPGDLAPQAGDVLVVLGREDNLRRLERLAASSAQR